MTRTRVAIWALVAALLLGAVLYQAKGVALLFKPEGGVDVRLRWQEQRYVMAGRNPYDVTYAVLGVGRAPSDPGRNAEAIPEVGIPDSGGYPPWAFFVGHLMFWPPWPEVKGYFLGVSWLLTAVTAIWAYRAVRPSALGREAGWLGVASVLAISGYSTCTHVGQYGAVVVGLLALSAWALSRRWDTAAGVLMGVALLKPTIAGPFVLVLLVMGRWRALGACIAYGALATGVVWWLTSTDPLEMLLQMLSAGSEYVEDSQGLIGFLVGLGLTAKQVTPVLAIGILVPGFAVLVWFRNRPVIELFAVASVVGRLWAYHKAYDNMMLAFLLVALARVAVASRRPLAVAGFLACGATAWAPASLAKQEAFVFAQFAVWVGGAAFVLIAGRSPRAGLSTGNNP